MTALDCAHYFLLKPDRDAGDDITHLKLQKLCYYAQAWHLAFTKRPLFPGRFEAWPHGPVCWEVWMEYRAYTWRPIPEPADFDPDVISPEDRQFLDEVWDAYGRFSAKYLEDLTHQEEPWIRARGNLQPGESCSAAIDEQLMARYYAALSER